MPVVVRTGRPRWRGIRGKQSVMSEVNFQLWEFEEAPPHLRNLVAEDFRGGWIALISSAESAQFASAFSTWWLSSGLPLTQREAGEGQIVLAGPHPHRHTQICA